LSVQGSIEVSYRLSIRILPPTYRMSIGKEWDFDDQAS
jgi:hypothetical protein